MIYDINISKNVHLFSLGPSWNCKRPLMQQNLKIVDLQGELKSLDHIVMNTTRTHLMKVYPFSGAVKYIYIYSSNLYMISQSLRKDFFKIKNMLSKYTFHVPCLIYIIMPSFHFEHCISTTI